MRRHMSHLAALTRREREIMNAVFALGNRASADAIRARLTSPPSDSSVRVMLTRLEKKGYLKHQQDGLRYLYSATISPAAAKRTARQSSAQQLRSAAARRDPARERRPVVGGAKVFETAPLGITEGWDPKSRAVPIRFTIPLS